jgi:predicted permease
MTLLLNDLRYAARVLLKSRAFTAVALVTLALAIGANTAIFSVINSLLLHPLPYPEADELVQVQSGPPEEPGAAVIVPEFLFVRDHNSVFSGVTAYDSVGTGFNLLAEGGEPEHLVGSRVSRKFFSVFGVRLQQGRDFSADEDRPGGAKVVILSDGLWKRRFHGDTGLVGKALHLNGESYTVIGIAPPGFRYPATAELWAPAEIDPVSQDKGAYLEITARLKDGVTLAKAKAEMKVLAEQLRAAHPDFLGEKDSIFLKTLQERLYGQLRTALLVLLGAVGCVLLIACVNVANLQLARATARRREMALRAALGARSSRLFSQLITESVLLALAGGALGLLLGWGALKPLLALAPEGQMDLALLPEIHIDGTVLAFTFGLSLVAGALFGLVPALQASRVDLHEPLKEGTNKSTGGRKGQFARRLLVISEVALALLLITSAALLIKSFSGLANKSPGFRPDHVLTLKLALPEARYGTPLALEQLSRNLTGRLRALPGVRAAAFASSLPLQVGPTLPFVIDGKWGGGNSTEGTGGARYRASSSSYFETMRIPLVRGRLLDERDVSNSEPVALINEAAVRMYWQGMEPLGSRIRVGPPAITDIADPQPRRIVGIVGDVHELGLENEPPAIIYVPIGQMPAPLTASLVRLLPCVVLVQTSGAPASVTAAVRKEVWALDPQQPISDVETLEAIVSRALSAFRFTMVLMGTLAVVALLLAAVGIYGVLSFLVGQRTREIGVRMALGASARNVVQMVVTQGMVSVAVGVAVGLTGAFFFARLLRSLLVGVSAHDPLTFVLAPLLLAVVALVATGIPAHRASRLDPVTALRQE